MIILQNSSVKSMKALYLRPNHQHFSIALSLFFSSFLCDWQVVPKEEEGVKESGKVDLKDHLFVLKDPRGISLLWRKPTSRRLLNVTLSLSVYHRLTEQKHKERVRPKTGALKNKYEEG